MLNEENYRFPKWQMTLLKLAGIYNFLWGAIVVLFPHLIFQNFGIPEPTYLIYWQCIGMLVAVLGIGYFISGFDPIRYWPMVLVGFLAKLFGTAGFVWGFSEGILSASFGYIILLNDILWLIPFGFMLMEIYKHWIYEVKSLEEEFFLEHHFNQVKTNQGTSLQEMSYEWPVVLVFLRHFGCTYCRETLQDLSQLREDLEQKGKALVIVHMSDEELAEEYLDKYGLRNVHHISDKNRNIYRYFGLRRGFLHQVFGPKIWIRFLDAGIKQGHGIGKFEGDGLQMPGVFLYYKGCIKKKYVHKTAADRPDYQEIIEYDLQPREAIQ